MGGRLRGVIAGLEELLEGPPEPVDWVLAFLHAAGGRAASRVHVVVGLYIASLRLGRLRLAAGFEECPPVPWSDPLADALKTLIALGQVKEDPGSGDLVLAPAGRAAAEEAWAALEPGERAALGEAAGLASRLRQEELVLLAYVEAGEPGWATEKLLSARGELAASAYERGAVDLETAARMAGMEPGEFKRFLEERKEGGE